MAINYYKCIGDCLGVVAVECSLEPGDRCSVCGGKFYFMGQVHQDKLVKHEDRVPCNSLCTHATGPRCDCRCGGENHGTGRVVVRLVVNGIPHIPMYDIDKCEERMNAYRPLRMGLERRLKAMRACISNQGDIQVYSYAFRNAVWRYTQRMNKKIAGLRSHFHRMKNGQAMINEMDAFIDRVEAGPYMFQEQVNRVKNIYNEARKEK